MKGKYIPFLILPLLLFVFLLLSPLGVKAKEKEIEDDGKKVILCHATPPSTAKNGFNLLNISKKAVFDKKEKHAEDGRAHDQHEMDIIPYFSYTVKEKTLTYDFDKKDKNGECKKGYEEYGDLEYCRKEVEKKIDIEKIYEGSRLWKLESGKIILTNNCIIPALCVNTMDPHDYSQWSEWNKPGDLITGWFRTRIAYSFDLIQKEIFENEEICEEEQKYYACDVTVKKVVEDEWKVDPVDSTKEYKVTTTYLLDSTDDEVICDSTEIRATRDITVEEEPIIDEEEDNGDILGEKDEVKEEKKIEEVGVVLAQTGSGSNIFVYVIQTLLSLSTILSGIFFSKKYIM